MYFSDEDISKIENYDYFSQNENDFYGKRSCESVLVNGNLSKKVPMLTVIIPTYKRPKMLAVAINSAINQIGFDDYEIIVVDNEGIDIETETETSKFIKSLNSTKVLYYRHTKTVRAFMMDAAVLLARTEWIMFLHDDDFLGPNTLRILSSVIRQDSSITWLSSNKIDFKSKNEESAIKNSNNEIINEEIVIEEIDKKRNYKGNNPGWLGALIKRANYISIGGMPIVQTGAGDTYMQSMYGDRYKMYKCICDYHMYNYRISDVQTSSTIGCEWTKIYLSHHLFHKYCNRKYHKILYKIWDYISWRRLLDAKQYMDSTEWNSIIDMYYIEKRLNIPRWWKKKGFRYYCVALYRFIYDKMYKPKHIKVRI